MTDRQQVEIYRIWWGTFQILTLLHVPFPAICLKNTRPSADSKG